MVFWPVGTGDSTTLVLGENLVMQVDLRDLKAADEDGAVVDEGTVVYRPRAWPDTHHARGR